jgi:hypothetical protein
VEVEAIVHPAQTVEVYTPLVVVEDIVEMVAGHVMIMLVLQNLS